MSYTNQIPSYARVCYAFRERGSQFFQSQKTIPLLSCYFYFYNGNPLTRRL